MPNPEWYDPSGNDGSRTTKVPDSISYTFTTSNIIILSTTGEVIGQDVTGLLYVPDLEPTDPCYNASAPYVPANVTRQANLPKIDYDLIGVAPWLSPQCTQNYFAAARLDPIRGFIFFQPTNTTAPPPAVSDPAWNLGDGDKWKSQNSYPIFAVSGLDGVRLTVQSSLYSGNLTGVPYGPQLAALYDPRDYVRLWVDIDTGQDTQFPHLWVFLLVVLSILLAIIALTTITMQLVQRRRRESLRRRVASGEVDLEALGIKRLTVPQDALNKMPLYIYGQQDLYATSSPRSSGSTGTNASRPRLTTMTAFDDVGEKSPTVVISPSDRHLQSTASGAAAFAPDDDDEPPISPARPPAALARTITSRTLPREHYAAYRPSPTSQPTCAICLDDFTLPSSSELGTLVRELPCHHIFHPECVDTFLRDSSSLCPMCKKSALPRGYCPRNITNAMVRRERLVRRIRERMEVDHPRQYSHRHGTRRSEDEDDDEEEYVVTSSSGTIGPDDHENAERRSRSHRRRSSDGDSDGSPQNRFARLRARAFHRPRRRSSATTLMDLPVPHGEYQHAESMLPASTMERYQGQSRLHSPDEERSLAQSGVERVRQQATDMMSPLRGAPPIKSPEPEIYSTVSAGRAAARGSSSRAPQGG